MAEEITFAELYRRLVDRNFTPSPDRAEALRNTLLRRLFETGQSSPGAENPGNKKAGLPLEVPRNL